ncbi:hypothetical protein WDZ16_00950 [Pseudokineococcus marinus]|uniref:Transmembrane protein n=1 Tax=Pseudokineococcus marinus TaxID=351215 RepID=A0A849BMX8_9ACTN|nr:hypothetical protein [Pseudokineococcus marinus]NNH21964.1 hypothetical protein [Pseudokineococcus marinus]
MGPTSRPAAPRWFPLLALVPVVTGVVAATTTGDVVATTSAALTAHAVVSWGANAWLAERRRDVHPRVREALVRRAMEPPWVTVPLVAGAVWAVVVLAGRVTEDAGDGWAWALLSFVGLALVLGVVHLARRALRRLRRRARARAADRATRRGARVA